MYRVESYVVSVESSKSNFVAKPLVRSSDNIVRDIKQRGRATVSRSKPD